VTIPDPGQIVAVRQRHFVVVEVSRSALPKNGFHPIKAEPHHLVTLSSVEDEALGEELQVIWEIEPGAKIHEKTTLPEPVGFDDPRRLDAFLDACAGARFLRQMCVRCSRRSAAALKSKTTSLIRLCGRCKCRE